MLNLIFSAHPELSEPVIAQLVGEAVLEHLRTRGSDVELSVGVQEVLMIAASPYRGSRRGGDRGIIDGGSGGGGRGGWGWGGAYSFVA